MMGSANVPSVLSAFQDTVLYADVRTSADGSSLTVEKLTTGSSVVDSILEAAGKELVVSSINNALKPQGQNSLGFKSIEFQEGKVKVQMDTESLNMPTDQAEE